MYEPLQVLAIKHLDEHVVENSRSGGVFTAISDYVLQQNGVVYGCVLDDNRIAKHIRVDNEEGRNKMRGSKYVQSDLGESFLNIEKDLKVKRKVLFSGTACQVEGILSYLENRNIDIENFITIEILCHGVPSPMIWQENLAWVEKKYKHRICNVDFRNKKKYGWKRHVETYTFNNNEEFDSGLYTKLFTRHFILRPSCYVCPFKGKAKRADITIADFWGIEKVSLEMNDDKGTSLVIVNSKKGLQYIKQVEKQLWCISTEIENAMQPPLVAPFPCPTNRDKFWQDFNKKGYDFVLKKYADYSVKQRILDSLPYCIRNVLRTRKKS